MLEKLSRYVDRYWTIRSLWVTWFFIVLPSILFDVSPRILWPLSLILYLGGMEFIIQGFTRPFVGKDVPGVVFDENHDSFIGSVYGIRFYEIKQSTKLVCQKHGDLIHLCFNLPASLNDDLQLVLASEPHLWSAVGLLPYGCNHTPEDPDGLKLYGGWGRQWSSPYMKASCTFKEHEAPYEDCLCGINMFDIIEGARRLYDPISKSYNVAALTEGYGKTQVHDDGYRVEHAEVLHLYIHKKLLKKLSAHYNDPALLDEEGGNAVKISGFENVPITTSKRKFLKAHKRLRKQQRIIPIPASEA